FAVNTEPIDLTLVPHDGAMTSAITGTDYRARVDDEEFQATRPYWDQLLVSESADVYRAEYLAVSILQANDPAGLTALHDAMASDTGLLPIVRKETENRFDEGYERGVHDHDAAEILQTLLRLHAGAGLLRFPPRARA